MCKSNGILEENTVYHSRITYENTELNDFPLMFPNETSTELKPVTIFLFSLYYVKGTAGNKKYKTRAALQMFMFSITKA